MRNRKKAEKRAEGSKNQARTSEGEATNPQAAVGDSEKSQGSGWSLWMVLYCVVGLVVAVVMGWRYAVFISQLHENHMYFSRIETVEREISFRTESGLFFSYFKQFVQSRTIAQGFHQLMHDNITEHGHTLNVMERMNIHQEVFLGLLFKIFRVPFLMNVEPVYFYLNAVWSLHAMYIMAIFCTVWLVTGTWAGGVLSVLLYVVNRQDTTRIWFTMPLRESFSMPFIFAQLLFVTAYFQRKRSANASMVLLAAIFVCTFSLSVTWQFAQFVLLLQAFALYSSQALQLVPTHKVRNVMLIQLASLALVCGLQFGNTLIPRSLAVSFILASLIVFTIQGDHGLRSRSFVLCFVKMLAYTALVFLLAAMINITIKMLIAEEADSHIYNFVRAKLGLSSPWRERDFDVLLYVCDPSFKGLPDETWTTLWKNYLLLPYIVTAGVLLVLLAGSVLLNWWRQSHPMKVKADNSKEQDMSYGQYSGAGNDWLCARPELAYHILYAAFFGFMALTTLRFKYLWTPHMCILAAIGVCDRQCMQWLLGCLRIKSESAAKVLQHLTAFGFAAFIVYMALPSLRDELAYLGEFYDPDTVALMQWIMKGTPKSAVFAGSMQLLAGVKLCTGRPITNHPHYEDKRLRERTRQIYQFYGKQSAGKVHEILRSVGTDYIILEDSICYAGNDARWPGCRLPDIVDRCNGHQLDSPSGIDEEELVPASHDRFCYAVDMDESYGELFRKAFSNPTFRVYKVEKTASEQAT